MGKIVTSSFKAPWYLRNPHLQTCLAMLGRYSLDTSSYWEEVQLPDGDFVDLVWLGTQAEGPIALLIPGLEGGLRAQYISSLVMPLLKQGWRVVVMHFRCCSGRMNAMPRGYSANDSDDLQMITASLRMQNPGVTIVGIGFSLGASILFKMLAELADLSFANTYLTAAIGVSVPYDLAKTIDYIPSFYQRYMLHSMKAKLKKKIEAGFNLPIDLKPVDAIKTLREFDQLVTAPLHGFASAAEYYVASSCGPVLHKIKTTSLLIHAQDDPLVPSECIPTEAALGESMNLEMSEYGGHLGFLSSALPKLGRQWLTQRILEFVKVYF